MPAYGYECKACGKRFTVIMSFADRDRKEKTKALRCPKCKSQNVKHSIEMVNVTTSKKS